MRGMRVDVPRRGSVAARWTAALALALAAAVLVAPPRAAVPTGHPASLTPHPPILIIGDAEFTAVNGVTGGAGTPADPFVIAGWDIDATAARGIEIRNTSASFVVRDVYVHSGNATFPGFEGIVFDNVTNGGLVNTTAYDNLSGVVLVDASGMSIRANAISRNYAAGIAAVRGADVTIANNSVFNVGTPGGVYVSGTSHVRVVGNVLTANVDDIFVRSVSDAVVSGNDVTGGTASGIHIESSKDVRITKNIVRFAIASTDVTGSVNVSIVNNVLTPYLYVSGSNGVSVYHNSFMTYPCTMERSATGNAWDAGYPAGGNYYDLGCWSDIPVDRCSGPGQDVCPDADGIVDTPRDDGSGILDHYPLLRACAPSCPPVPPRMLPARLTGAGGADVHLSWERSSDDATRGGDVIAYEVWRGTTFNWTAASYTVLATLPAGATSYDDLGAGVGDTATRFYALRAVDGQARGSAAYEQAGKFAQRLPAGMHLISVPLEQADWRVGEVLRTIPWTSARTYANVSGQGTWLSNFPGKAWGSFRAADRTQAIWVNVTADASWTIAGLVPRSTAIPLRPGWNLIGYPSFLGRTVTTGLQGLAYDRVESFAGLAPYYLTALMGSSPLLAGDGYWVHIVGAGAVLVWRN